MNIQNTVFIRIIGLICVAGMLLTSCNTEQQKNKPLTIGISKLDTTEHYSYYGKYIEAADSTAILVDLYHTSTDSGMMLFKDCDALLLCGGPDIYPGWYGKEYDTSSCGEFDRRRDTLEMALFNEALRRKIPVLGICRGQQLINVALGGTLFRDIPTQYPNAITHRCDNPDSCFHAVYVSDSSMLHKITGVKIGVVNTNHHQGIEKTAPALIVTGNSEDGFSEVVQWKIETDKSWLLGVQWHPERLNYKKNPFSLPIAMRFLEEAKK